MIRLIYIYIEFSHKQQLTNGTFSENFGEDLSIRSLAGLCTRRACRRSYSCSCVRLRSWGSDGQWTWGPLTEEIGDGHSLYPNLGHPNQWCTFLFCGKIEQHNKGFQNCLARCGWGWNETFKISPTMKGLDLYRLRWLQIYPTNYANVGEIGQSAPLCYIL